MSLPTSQEQRDAMAELNISILHCHHCRNDIVVRNNVRPLYCPACRRDLSAPATRRRRMSRIPQFLDPRRQAPPNGFGQRPT